MQHKEKATATRPDEIRHQKNKKRALFFLIALSLAAYIYYEYYEMSRSQTLAEISNHGGDSWSALFIAYNASKKWPHASWPREQLDSIADAYVENLIRIAQSNLDNLTDSRYHGGWPWPNINKRLDTISDTFSKIPYFTQTKIDNYRKQYLKEIYTTAIQGAQQSNSIYKLKSMAIYYAAASQTNYNDQDNALITLRTAFLQLIQENMDRGYLLETYNILTGLRNNLSAKSRNSTEWKDAFKLIDICKAKKGIKVPKEGRWREIFRNAEYILLDPSSNEDVSSFLVQTKIIKRGPRNGFVTSQSGMPAVPGQQPDVYVSDVFAKTTAYIFDPDRKAIKTIEAEGHSHASEGLYLLNENDSLQGSLDKAAIREAEREAEKKLIDILNKMQ